MVAKVTKIICPSCKGSGLWGTVAGRGVRCFWCAGAKRISTVRARMYAQSLKSIAVGGYLAGDHDLSDCRSMEADADRVLALLDPRPS